MRLEYDADGVFEDRATQCVANRSFPEVDFRLEKTENELIIETDIFRLVYKYG